MKVFISWSGETSHVIAKILRDWLPSVIQSIEPYVSSEDIDKGARWSSDIAGELDSSSYGIICLTPDNLSAPWINFEAGALGKSVDKSRVSPVLFRLAKSELKGPLVQFQATVFEQDDVLKLMQSVNNALGDDALEEGRLAKAFAAWWPDLESQLANIGQAPAAPKAQRQLDPEKINGVLEELIDLTRANHKLLREPGALFHPSMMEHFIAVDERFLPIAEDAFLGLRTVQKRLAAMREDKTLQEEAIIEIDSLLERIEKPLMAIINRSAHSKVRLRRNLIG